MNSPVTAMRLSQDLEPGDVFEIGDNTFGVEAVEHPRDLPDFTRVQLSLLATSISLPQAPGRAAEMTIPFGIPLVLID